eukprot:2401925-Ditylum_brightwellii.AAC.1
MALNGRRPPQYNKGKHAICTYLGGVELVMTQLFLLLLSSPSFWGNNKIVQFLPYIPEDGLAHCRQVKDD